MALRISGPREGWLSLLLLIVVVICPAYSLADAAWVDNLWVAPWLALFSVLLGVVLAKLPVRGRVAHPFALVIGLGLVGTFFATIPPQGDWDERFLWLGGRVWAWLEIAFGGGMSNDDMLFALLMGMTAWLLGYLSAWLAFRMHNVWPVLVACGSGLLLNLSYGASDPWRYFLVFLVASMLLLVRVTLSQREPHWDRADVQENRGLTWSFLWRSALLSVLILVTAWTVPAGSVHADVAESWYNITGPWQGLQVEFDRLFSSVGSTTGRVEGNRFGKTLALKGAIELGPEPVMVVASPMPEYWAAQTYDRYTAQGWMSTAPQSTRLDANDERLMTTSLYQGRRDIEQRFKLLKARITTVFAATSPVKLSLAVYADHFDSLEDMTALRSTITMRQGQQYGVISSVSVASISQLRKAGTDYPEWTARYLELPERFPRRVGLLATRLATNADNRYDAALALQEHLRGFRYELKVASPPTGRDVVEWFLFNSREGYCDYFASAMAVMARAIGIPSRVVSGYMTGTFIEEMGLYQVRQENAHSWPELFFPEYGWVRFEPTPSQPTPERLETSPEEEKLPGELEEGDMGALSFDLIGRDGMLLDDEFDLLTGEFSMRDAGGNTAVLWSVVAFPAALLALSLLLWMLWRSMLAPLTLAGRSYYQMSFMAGLLGWRLRPSHTPMEYGRLISAAAPDLLTDVRTVVDSYVEETYGRRRPAREDAVQGSWRIVRTRLPQQLLVSAIRRQASELTDQLSAFRRRWSVVELLRAAVTRIRLG